MSVVELSDDQIKHIFVEVALGRGRHGGFLRSIADAVQHADHRNFGMMRPLLKVWIRDSGLDQFLDTYQPALQEQSQTP